MDHREEVSEDGESPSHVFGTICSAGVAGDEASELRCPARFLSDMPDSARPWFGHLPDGTNRSLAGQRGLLPHPRGLLLQQSAPQTPTTRFRLSSKGSAGRYASAARSSLPPARSSSLRPRRVLQGPAPGLRSAAASSHQLSCCFGLVGHICCATERVICTEAD